jgi:uracil phosphoribosyltransferase
MHKDFKNEDQNLTRISSKEEKNIRRENEIAREKDKNELFDYDTLNEIFRQMWSHPHISGFDTIAFLKAMEEAKIRADALAGLKNKDPLISMQNRASVLRFVISEIKKKNPNFPFEKICCENPQLQDHVAVRLEFWQGSFIVDFLNEEASRIKLKVLVLKSNEKVENNIITDSEKFSLEQTGQRKADYFAVFETEDKRIIETSLDLKNTLFKSGYFHKALAYPIIINKETDEAYRSPNFRALMNEMFAVMLMEAAEKGQDETNKVEGIIKTINEEKITAQMHKFNAWSIPRGGNLMFAQYAPTIPDENLAVEREIAEKEIGKVDESPIPVNHAKQATPVLNLPKFQSMFNKIQDVEKAKQTLIEMTQTMATTGWAELNEKQRNLPIVADNKNMRIKIPTSSENHTDQPD